MSFRVRPARGDDFDAIYEMAKLTGGGFTNLPADRGTLVAKLARSDTSFARPGDEQSGDLYVFVLEDPERGLIRGTCQVFGQVGVVQPFYSYHLSTLTQSSPELGKTFRNQMLSLTTDLEGCSEVGGLFLHPEVRSGGWGTLLARSRYLFIKQHRARFGDRILAELRGVMDEAGNSPFWDALAGRFFDMSFPEADQFNAIHGTRFIADLMPRTPIYVALLAEAAQAVIGQPHPTGAAALQDARGGRLRVRPLRRHFRRRADGHRADRQHPHGPRGGRGNGASRSATAATQRMLLAAGKLQGFRRLRRDGPADAGRGRCASTPRRPSCSASRSATRCWRSTADVALAEINFDGIVGPSHNYAGLSLGNLASTRNAGAGLAAARRGAAGRRQDARQSRARPRPGHLRCPTRGRNRAWLAELGTTIDDGRAGARRQRHVGLGDVGGQCGDRLAGARHRRRPLPPDRRQSAHHGAPQPRMAGDAGPAAAGLRRRRAFRRPRARSRRRSATRARPITCGWRRPTASRASRSSSTA